MAPDPPSPASLTQQQISTNTQFSIWDTLKLHMPRLFITFFVDVILPLLIYFSLQKSLQPIYTLLLSGVPPLLMVIFKAVIFRALDALGFLVCMSFIFTGLIAVITRNPIILLLEKSLASVVISFMFAITLIPSLCCPQLCQFRPIAYYFYKDLLPTNAAQTGLPESVFIEEVASKDEHGNLISKLPEKEETPQVYRWIYEHCSSFRYSCYLITVIWSVGFFCEFSARFTLILLHLSVTKIFVYGNIILTLITSLCVLFTLICISKERKETLESIEQWKDEHLKTLQ